MIKAADHRMTYMTQLTRAFNDGLVTFTQKPNFTSCSKPNIIIVFKKKYYLKNTKLQIWRKERKLSLNCWQVGNIFKQQPTTRGQQDASLQQNSQVVVFIHRPQIVWRRHVEPDETSVWDILAMISCINHLRGAWRILIKSFTDEPKLRFERACLQRVGAEFN